MPFKSLAQMRYLFAKEPTIAKRWSSKYGISKSLPKKKGISKLRNSTKQK